MRMKTSLIVFVIAAVLIAVLIGLYGSSDGGDIQKKDPILAMESNI